MNQLPHPRWCARSYRCTAQRGGEHLSAPTAVPAAGGRAATTVSLSQAVTGAAPTVEIRPRVRLTEPDESAQARLVRRLLARVNAAGGEVTG